MTWTYVMEEKALPEGGMAPAYPLGVNIVIARVSETIYDSSAKRYGCHFFLAKAGESYQNVPQILAHCP